MRRLQVVATPVLGCLSDAIGRRPVFVWGALVDTATMFAFVWADGPWWVCIGALQGLFDATWALNNAIWVDAIGADSRNHRCVELMSKVLDV